MTQPAAPPPGPPSHPGPPSRPGPPSPSGGGGRVLLVGLVVLVIAAFLLSALAVAVVSQLVGGEDEAAPSSAPPPTYVAPSPMTRVETPHYSFSHPEHWQATEDDEEDMDYALTLMDVTENSRAVVLDFVIAESMAATCEELSNSGGSPYERQAGVEIDGRPALHYQGQDEDEKGRPRIQDIWCVQRGTNVVVVIGRTAGPEAEAAGISEAQKVLDTWEWTDEPAEE